MAIAQRSSGRTAESGGSKCPKPGHSYREKYVDGKMVSLAALGTLHRGCASLFRVFNCFQDQWCSQAKTLCVNLQASWNTLCQVPCLLSSFPSGLHAWPLMCPLELPESARLPCQTPLPVSLRKDIPSRPTIATYSYYFVYRFELPVMMLAMWTHCASRCRVSLFVYEFYAGLQPQPSRIFPWTEMRYSTSYTIIWCRIRWASPMSYERFETDVIEVDRWAEHAMLAQIW